MVFLAIVGACAVVAALLSFFLYKLGVFLIVFFAVLAFATSILITVQGTVFSVSLGKGSMLAAGIAAVAALVCAVLSVIFSEPVIIIATAVSGGMSVGPALLKLSGVGAELWMRYAAGAAFIVLGMGVNSRRRKNAGIYSHRFDYFSRISGGSIICRPSLCKKRHEGKGIF